MSRLSFRQILACSVQLQGLVGNLLLQSLGLAVQSSGVFGLEALDGDEEVVQCSLGQFRNLYMWGGGLDQSATRCAHKDKGRLRGVGEREKKTDGFGRLLHNILLGAPPDAVRLLWGTGSRGGRAIGPTPSVGGGVGRVGGGVLGGP